jgi:hypothetical protein
MNKNYSLEDLRQKHWFQKLNSIQKELIAQSFYLAEDTDFFKKTFFDYSFIVMPAAKAYEGVIKDKIFALKLISEERYKGKRFRVGKALNPELAKEHPNAYEALYDDLEKMCGSQLPEKLWKTWRNCRNRVFHFFTGERQDLTLHEAKQKLQQILQAIEAFSHCLQ